MQAYDVDVKTRDGQSASCQVTQYDTLDEAIEKLGKEHCLELVNQLHKKHAMDGARQKLQYEAKIRWQRQAAKMLTAEDFDRIGRGEVLPETLINKYAEQLKTKNAQANGSEPVSRVTGGEEPDF